MTLHLFRRAGFLTALAVLALALLAAACSQPLIQTPREATLAAASRTPPPTDEPVVSLAATPTGLPIPPTSTPLVGAPRRTITVWVDETSPAHTAALAEIGQAFTDANDVHVEFIQVLPDLMPMLVKTAVLSDTLPDIILHSLEFTFAWERAGILDGAAAAQIVADLGPATFDPDALELVTMDRGLTAVPSDGYKQLIIYRTDWFAERGLAPPDTFDAMLAAASTLYFTPTLTAGFVIPTEADLLTTQYAFEHMATANGCELVDARGEIVINSPACLDALRFYRQIVNQYSPSDVQTDISTLNAYLAGRAGLIMAPPSVLPRLAGLDPNFPPSCPGCDAPDFLAQNSGVLTHLTGHGPAAAPATFGQMRLLGVTSAADGDAALAFARHWFSDGYLTWLGVDAARKAPLRLGDADDPARFLDAWDDLPLVAGGPSLNELFGPAVVADLGRGVAATQRWGFRQGQGELIGVLAENFTLSLLLQELLSGYFGSEQTIVEAYSRVTELIPGYAFFPTPTPTPTSDE